MQNIISFVKGKKTYFVAAAMASYALVGMTTGWMEQSQAVALLFQALALAGIRHGIASKS